jgi:hypothetical protein
MEFVSGQNGPKCRKCLFPGPMKEGPMNEINEAKKRAPRGMTASPSASVGGQSLNQTTANELAARLKALKGKSSEDVEFL